MGGRVQRFADLLDELVERAGAASRCSAPPPASALLALAAQRALAGGHRAAERGWSTPRGVRRRAAVRRVSPARLSEALSSWNGAGAPAGALGELYRAL